MAIVHDFCRSMMKNDVCIESEPLEVKVLLIFSGMVGFLPHMEGQLTA